MSLIPRILPLPIHTPVPPDSFICNGIYGQNISPFACQNLVDTQWPSGDDPIPLYLHDPAPSSAIHLPYTVRARKCRVSIEAAGPGAPKQHYLTVSPNQLRSLAGFIIEKCPLERRGLGGFVSFGMVDVQTFVTKWGLPTNSTDPHDSGYFLTVSVYGNDRVELRPGDTDPAVSGLITVIAQLHLQNWIPRRTVRNAVTYLTEFLRHRTIEMTRGGNLTWWDGLLNGGLPQAKKQKTTTTPTNSQTTMTSDTAPIATANSLTTADSWGIVTAPSDPDSSSNPSPPPNGNGIQDPTSLGDMTYQCDSTLGPAPNPTDCEQLSYSGLQPPSSIESLQPNVPKFYSQGTCTLGISSTHAIAIPWSRLLTAFATLSNLCIQNPVHSAKGGRAYFGHQITSSWINGKRDSVSGISGLDALSPGINTTIFHHGASADMACEWALAGEGKDIVLCEGV